ncbi:MAG: peptidoglycan DD-metalloendopeptidase family protein [Candidatus Riflebacteria bacterium]|nr:peptidoglycan DD-metalloendopeptidase family protein [Candidatus Riflebacteria bacterium]
MDLKSQKIERNSKQIESLQDELGSLKVQIEYLNMKVRDASQSQKKLEDKIAKTRKQKDELLKNLGTLASESSEIDQQMEEASRETKNLTTKTNETISSFKQKLIKLHKIRQGSMISGIFASQDVETFLNKFHYTKFFLEQDKKTLKGLYESREKIRLNTVRLEEKKKRLTEVSNQYQTKQAELALQSSQLLAMLQTLVLEKKLFLKRQERTHESYEALDREIAKIESKRPKEMATLEADFEGKNGETQETNGPEADETKAAESKMAKTVKVASSTKVALPFIWPVADVSSFGFKDENGGGVNSLEIHVKNATEIKAVAKGKVLFKGPMGQFGNVMILGHAKGYSTVYGRLDEMWTGLGQILEAGDPIGYINGGPSASLHFEIRQSGRCENPLAFLPKPK